MKKLAAYAVVALGVAGIGWFTGAKRDDSGAIVSSGTIDAFQIRVGDCFDDAASVGEETEVSGVRGVPCSQPHDNEVYAVFDVDPTEFPEGDGMGRSPSTPASSASSRSSAETTNRPRWTS